MGSHGQFKNFQISLHIESERLIQIRIELWSFAGP